MSFFFISYKSEDRDFALKLKSLIEEAGFLGWMDVEKLRGGDEWKLAIDTAIEASLGVIVIITVKALRSQYVTYEWSYAKGLKKPVLPVIKEFPDPNNKAHPKIHPKLDDIQYRLFMDESDPSTYEKEKLLGDLAAIKRTTEVPDAVQNAAKMLDDPDPQRVDMGIQKLLATDHLSVMEKLAEAVINNHDDTVKAKAAIALARKSNFRDERAIPGLKIALSHTNKASQALEAFGQYNTENAINALYEILHSLPNYSDLRRRAIVDTMSELNPQFVLPLFRLIISNTVIGERVDPYVLHALADLQDHKIVPDLIKRIEVHDGTKYDPQVIQALGKLGNPIAVESITNVLSDIELRNHNNQKQIVEAAINALGQIREEESLNALVQIDLSKKWASYWSLLRDNINKLESQLQDSS